MCLFIKLQGVQEVWFTIQPVPPTYLHPILRGHPLTHSCSSEGTGLFWACDPLLCCSPGRQWGEGGGSSVSACKMSWFLSFASSKGPLEMPVCLSESGCNFPGLEAFEPARTPEGAFPSKGVARGLLISCLGQAALIVSQACWPGSWAGESATVPLLR